MNKRFGKNDLIFIGVLLVVCLAVLLTFLLRKDDGSGFVVVTVDGREYGRYLLSEEQTIPITDEKGTVTNLLVLKDGKADIREADCPDHLCVKQRAISRGGENLVCLPNRVVVTVECAQEGELDGFVQ